MLKLVDFVVLFLFTKSLATSLWSFFCWKFSNFKKFLFHRQLATRSFVHLSLFLRFACATLVERSFSLRVVVVYDSNLSFVTYFREGNSTDSSHKFCFLGSWTSPSVRSFRCVALLCFERSRRFRRVEDDGKTNGTDRGNSDAGTRKKGRFSNKFARVLLGRSFIAAKNLHSTTTQTHKGSLYVKKTLQQRRWLV